MNSTSVTDDDDLAPPDGPPDLRVMGQPCADSQCDGEYYWYLPIEAVRVGHQVPTRPSGHALTPGAAVADGLAALRQVRP